MRNHIRNFYNHIQRGIRRNMAEDPRSRHYSFTKLSEGHRTSGTSTFKSKTVSRQSQTNFTAGKMQRVHLRQHSWKFSQQDSRTKVAWQGGMFTHRRYFLDLAEAHKFYASAAKGLADIAGLVSPEQLTLILAAAVPPTLQLVLPPGQILPLSTPPPPPKTSTTLTGR